MKIFPSDNEKLITACIISYMLGITSILVLKIEGMSVTLLLPAVTTLGAAFLGAKYAFTLQNQIREKEEVKRQVEAGNKTIFSMINTHDRLFNYRDQFINKYRDSVFKHVAILPSIGMVSYKEIDFDSLAFLLGSSDRDILMEISLFETKAKVAFELIKVRSRYHGSKVQDKIEESGLGLDDKTSVERLNEILGPRTFITLENYTNDMIESTDEVIDISESLINRLSATLKKRHKGHVVISIEKPNNALNSQASPAGTPESGAR